LIVRYTFRLPDPDGKQYGTFATIPWRATGLPSVSHGLRRRDPWASPPNHLQNTSVRPFLPMARQSSSDRILSHIGKLLRVMIRIPHLGVPHIHLPLAIQCRKILTSQALPITAPPFHALRMWHTGHAEKMEVIRHEHKLAHPPLTRLLPRHLNGLHGCDVVEECAPIQNAHRTEQNDRIVEAFNSRMMCRILPIW